MIRQFATTLALLSSLSIGFSFPAHAHNHNRNHNESRKPAQSSTDLQKLLDQQTKLKAELTQERLENIKVYDSQGQATTLEALLVDARAFHEGFAVDIGTHRLRIRGEILDEGKKGVLLIATREVNGEAVNGQVMTLKAGMTKNEIQSRLSDLMTSLTSDLAASIRSASAKRDVASGIASSDDGKMRCMGAAVLALFAYVTSQAVISLAREIKHLSRSQVLLIGIPLVLIPFSSSFMAAKECRAYKFGPDNAAKVQ